VAGYTALQSGLATVPVTIVIFALSRRFGALADRYGPRRLMGAGPLIASAGIFLLLRTGIRTAYLSDLLPALLVAAGGITGLLGIVDPKRAVAATSCPGGNWSELQDPRPPTRPRAARTL
jgi:MFS family permease